MSNQDVERNGLRTQLDFLLLLRMGADDYLPKPFEVAELIARIEALRRRAGQNGRLDTGLFEFGGDVCINLYSRMPHTRTVDVHMWQLRRKLEADPQEPRFLQTVHGTGYLFAWDSGP